MRIIFLLNKPSHPATPFYFFFISASKKELLENPFELYSWIENDKKCWIFVLFINRKNLKIYALLDMYTKK